MEFPYKAHLIQPPPGEHFTDEQIVEIITQMKRDMVNNPERGTTFEETEAIAALIYRGYAQYYEEITGG